MLDFAGRRRHGLSKSALLPDRHGAGRGRLDQGAAEGRLPLRRGRHQLARRALPRLRREGAGHRERRRRGRRGAEAARRRARRRRLYPRRHQGRGDQQRRFSKGRLHGAERGRSGRGDCRGALRRARSPRDRRLRRGAWDGHGARRPHRGGRAHASLPRGDEEEGLLRARLRQDEHRPPRTRPPAWRG